MNDRGIKRGILQRMDRLPEDSVFTATDFSDIAGSDSIRQVFKELANNGVIARAARGVYYKPRYSNMLRQSVPPNVDKVAEAVARARGWEIVPSGDHALNILGLDTQVPAIYVYISTGPYADVQVGPFEVKFKHAANKNIVEMSRTTALTIQALKTLGKENISNEVIEHLQRRLSKQEKQLLFKETNRSTAWIREAVKKIVGRGLDD